MKDDIDFMYMIGEFVAQPGSRYMVEYYGCLSRSLPGTLVQF